MSSVWVIDKTPGLALKIMGSYAIRLFSSMNSAWKCSNFSTDNPILICVNCSNVPISSKTNMTQLTFEHFTSSPLSVLYFENKQIYLYKKNHPEQIFNMPENELELSSLLNSVSKELLNKAKDQIIVRYKDLTINRDSLQLNIHSTKESKILRRKEALLLVNFMKQPNSLIFRENIKKDIWNGLKISDKTLNSHISRLRNIISGSEVTLENHYNQGYIFS
jgi:hypothetical protein